MRLRARVADLEAGRRADTGYLEPGNARIEDFALAAADWLWEMDEELRFSYFSEHFAEITGVPQETLLGKTREETGIPSLEPEAWQRHLADLAAHRPFRDFRHLRKRPDGSTVLLSISGGPVFDAEGRFRGYRGTGTDITKREAEASNNGHIDGRQLLAHAVEALNDGFVIYDAEKRLVLCNKRYQDLYHEIADLMVPGARLEDLARETARLCVGLTDKAEIEGWTRQRMAQIRETNAPKEQKLKGERWIRVSEHTLPNGWSVGLRSDITELKRREEALKESGRYLAKAQRIAQFGHWIWDETKQEMASFSEEVPRILGIPPRRVAANLEDSLELIHPEDRERYATVVGQAEREAAGYEITFRIVRPDGEIRHLHELAEAEFDEDGRFARTVGTIHDVTEVKRAEEALRESEERYRLVVEHTPSGILLYRNGRIAFANPSAVKALGAEDEGDLIGLSPFDIAHPDIHDLVRARVEAVERGEVLSPVEQVFVRRDRSAFDVEVFAKPVSYQGQTAILTVFRDVTEQKRAEEALHAAKEQAEIANRAKSEFLANMSHELRTPLNAIIGFSEMIEQEKLGALDHPQYRDYVDDILTSGRHLLDLIGDILDLSKIEAGNAKLTEDVFDLADSLNACMRLIAERAKENGVELRSELPPAPLPLLGADPRMVKQILINLLSNAVKFTPQGGSVTARLRASPDEGYVIEIADTGIGIAPRDIPKALARFQQIDSQMNRRFQGSGLGLPLSKALVELHGGSLTLESELGAGTTVTLRFPPERVSPRGRSRRAS
ncbi:MAG: PAS domain S-box protein [Rhodospirillales bacterium]|nr:PAS domain S-box protein [Rhodospirillales bacterium]